MPANIDELMDFDRGVFVNNPHLKEFARLITAPDFTGIPDADLKGVIAYYNLVRVVRINKDMRARCFVRSRVANARVHGLVEARM